MSGMRSKSTWSYKFPDNFEGHTSSWDCRGDAVLLQSMGLGGSAAGSVGFAAAAAAQSSTAIHESRTLNSSLSGLSCSHGACMHECRAADVQSEMAVAVSLWGDRP